MPIKFTLNETMRLHNIRQKDLFDVCGVRMNTIKDLRLGDAKCLTIEKLDDLVRGINKMTGQNYGIECVIKYEEEE